MSSIKWKSFKIRHEKLLKIMRIVLILLVAAIIISSCVSFFVNKSNYNSNERTIVVSPQICYVLTNSYPHNLNPELKAIYDEAEIEYYDDEYGNLILTWNASFFDGLVDTYKEFINESVAGYDIKISSDYNRIEVNAKHIYSMNGMQSLWSIRECAWLQLYSGVLSSKIKVDVVIIDYDTNQVVYEATWPYENISYTYKGDGRTSTYSLVDGYSDINHTYDK